jgi:hypothetical protein
MLIMYTNITLYIQRGIIMSKEYWNGVMNRLPNFLNKMGNLCMQTSMMDYQMRNSCCHGGSIWGGPGGYYGGYPGYYGGGNGGASNYWNSAGMMQSIYGDMGSQGSYAGVDPVFQQGIQNAIAGATVPQSSASVATPTEAQTTAQTPTQTPTPTQSV